MENDTRDEKIKFFYQRGKGSIQDLARIFNVEVSYVLNLIGEGQLTTITTGGDLIDPNEAGPGATINYGKTFNVPFDVK